MMYFNLSSPLFYMDDTIHASGGKDQKRIIIELNEFYEFIQLTGVMEAIKPLICD